MYLKRRPGTSLGRLGFDHVTGYLAGGMEALSGRPAASRRIRMMYRYTTRVPDNCLRRDHRLYYGREISRADRGVPSFCTHADPHLSSPGSRQSGLAEPDRASRAGRLPATRTPHDHGQSARPPADAVTVRDPSAVSWQREPAIAVSIACFMSATRTHRIRWIIFSARSTPDPQPGKSGMGLDPVQCMEGKRREFSRSGNRRARGAVPSETPPLDRPLRIARSHD